MFEPNGVETNALECDGALQNIFYLYPTVFQSGPIYNQFAIIDHVVSFGPIIFYVPEDPPAYDIPEDPPAFMVPQPVGNY